MTEYQKMISSQPYNCMASELDVLRRETARRYRRFNRVEEEDEQLALLQEIVGELAENAFICPPFYCTYGRHISLGAGSYVNMGATFLDNAPIRIGANVMIGPNVQIYTAAHALAADERIQGEGDGAAGDHRRQSLDWRRRHTAARCHHRAGGHRRRGGSRHQRRACRRTGGGQPGADPACQPLRRPALMQTSADPDARAQALPSKRSIQCTTCMLALSIVLSCSTISLILPCWRA